MDNWQGISGQVVWFAIEAQRVHAHELFTAIWSEEPEQVQSNRVLSPSAPFFSRAATEKDGLVRQVQIGQGRIDVIASAMPDDSRPFGIPFDAFKVIGGMIKDVGVPTSASVYRLAIVANFIKPVATYEQSARMLYEMLGYDPGLGDVTDLMFQVNKRTAFEGCEINRLVTLATAAAQNISLEFSPAVGHRSQESLLGLAARRQLDFNTIPNGNLFSIERQIAVLQFIAREMERIMQSGDVRALTS